MMCTSQNNVTETNIHSPCNRGPTVVTAISFLWSLDEMCAMSMASLTEPLDGGEVDDAGSWRCGDLCESESTQQCSHYIKLHVAVCFDRPSFLNNCYLPALVSVSKAHSKLSAPFANTQMWGLGTADCGEYITSSSHLTQWGCMA